MMRLIGLAFVLACGDDAGTRVEIYPEVLQVESDLPRKIDVTIAAHVRGKKGGLLNAPITWTTSTGAPFTVSPSTGGMVTLSIEAHTPEGTAEITAQAAGESSTLSVTFVKNPNPATSDVARAEHADGWFPSVALVSGKEGNCKSHVVFAFVGVAELGDFSAGPCVFTERAVIFTQNAAPRFYSPYEWQGPAGPFDEFNPPPGTPPPPPPTDSELLNRPAPPSTPPGFTPLRIKVHALGVREDVARPLLEEGLKVALARFTEGLAGIYFDVPYPIDVRLGGDYEHVRECDALYDLISTDATLADEESLHLYYVPKIIWSFRGIWCAKPTVNGPYPRNLILISTTNFASTTLAHEIGHALAQNEPWAWRGHADLVKGMSSDNLMWAGLEDDQADSRWRLGVGQVFRMYLDRRSWFNSGYVPAGLNCGCDPYKITSCPKLSADVLTLADKGARVRGPTCP